MPFEVTATRKRPQNFEQLAGQNFVAATLISSLEQGRIAHAYLFSGPRGCGKTSTARILAKALNCEHGPTPHPCGTCASCREIAAGSSLDVIEIDGASNTSVDNIRQIKDEVLFAPNTGRYKIYIIDEVHMLSMSAFNALLKTIEEPPPYIVFIFATTEPQKVPATIKSRCQQFNFRLVPVEILVNLLRQVADETGIEAEDEALRWIAREAEGSVRDAYTLFDQIASFSGSRITAMQIRQTLGLVGQDQLNALFGALAEGNAKEAFMVLDEVLTSGVSPEQLLADAIEYLRSVLLIGIGIEKESLLSATKASFNGKVLEIFTPEKAEYAVGVMLDTFRHLKETVDPRYELELSVAKLSRIASYIGPAELFGTIASLRSAITGAGALRTAGKLDERANAGAQNPFAMRTAAPSSIQRGTELPFQDRARSTSAHAGTSRDVPARSHEETSSPSLRLPASEAVSTMSAASSDTAGTTASPAREPQAEATAETKPANTPMAVFRKRLITALRKENPFLASALEKSAPWTPKHQGVIIPVTNKVELDLINRFSALISQTAAAIEGRSFAVEIRFEKADSAGKGLSNRTESPQTGGIPRSERTTKTPVEQSQASSTALEKDLRADISAGTFRSDAEPFENELDAPDLASQNAGRQSAETADEAHGIHREGEKNGDRAEEEQTSFSRSRGSSTPQPQNPGTSMTERDRQFVSLIEHLFKGKLIATAPAPGHQVIRSPFPARLVPEPEDEGTDIEIPEPETEHDDDD